MMRIITHIPLQILFNKINTMVLILQNKAMALFCKTLLESQRFVRVLSYAFSVSYHTPTVVCLHCLHCLLNKYPGKIIFFCSLHRSYLKKRPNEKKTDLQWHIAT